VERPSWAPPEVDLDRPSTARIYDYMLGGSHNFAVDRQMAELVLAAAPHIRPSAHANRDFLRRAVEYLVRAGIRQFLDIGSGVPTVGNVHEVAQREAPEARVVYVDIDPVAVAHSRAIVAGNERVSVVQADFRQPESILYDRATRTLLDFQQPIAILLVGLLHFILDRDNPRQVIGALREAVPAGSYLVVAQVSMPTEITEAQREMMEQYTRANPVAMRSPAEIAAFFDGFHLVEPGLVETSRWHPAPGNFADRVELMPSYSAVGIKPA
jgi:SAM-dependent methyltransferase